MLPAAEKKSLNKITGFEINPKSVYTICDEVFNENSVSASRKKLLALARISAKFQKKCFQRAGIMFFFKSSPTFNFMNGVH